ncbi:putative sulfate exporter family transporter [Microbacterium sp. LMC-P-041]|uniref:YeiH family protein n=1 Tax=Microbacterium sp. LMC-P-041 TaxID=3040293 RepID=UPI002554EB6E|nr:putative sulfate exporter family transporter [Microbacterium sp. LMC-P-041]
MPFALGAKAPGLLMCLGIAIAATVVGGFVPIVGSALPAIIIGGVWAIIRRPGARFTPGIATATKPLLQFAIVLLGARMSLGQVADVGLTSLPVLLSSLFVCLIAAWLVGRALGVERDTRILLGVGTGICGASAIAAVAPVIRANPSQIAYAVSTIFLFNVAAVLTFPWVGHALGYDATTFGLFAGTAVNDTSSVVAAASIFSTAALGYAIVVKLVRTLALIPITVGLAVMEARRSLKPRSRIGPRKIVKLVPWFLVGFVLMVILNTHFVFPADAVGATSAVSTFLIAAALAGIGLTTDLGAIQRAGWRPLLLGAILWILVSGVTIGAIGLLDMVAR